MKCLRVMPNQAGPWPVGAPPGRWGTTCPIRRLSPPAIRSTTPEPSGHRGPSRAGRGGTDVARVAGGRQSRSAWVRGRRKVPFCPPRAVRQWTTVSGNPLDRVVRQRRQPGRAPPTGTLYWICSSLSGILCPLAALPALNQANNPVPTFALSGFCGIVDTWFVDAEYLLPRP